MRNLLVPVIAAPIASLATTVAGSTPALEDTLTGIAELVVQIIIGIIALIGLIRSLTKNNNNDE